ncbi:PilM [Desulfamplus magnetovallimortis]|uniref:PilM n=1 Tax=Desulfamplus magnetovallimortis TaxID=1246637 RepID=A0A1W1HIC0_9BACT|nr:type IV pilus assembly protein PilM [Desulfamplus magnetovallimortis]SLM32196.1 PilM [Desulfamplus magnetovallimortis]
MLLSKKGHLVGLDIGSSVIKVAELKTSGKDISLVKFGMTPIPPGLIEDGEIIEIEQLAGIIKNLFKTHKIKTKNVAIATGGSSVVVKTITVPAVSESALVDSIRFEAEQYIPYDIDDMNIDFQIMDDSDVAADQMNVLLVAAKKDLVAEYIDLIDLAGLNPSIIDVDSFAFQNIYEVFCRKKTDTLDMIIDVGVTKTTMNIVKGFNSLMMRDSSSGIGQVREMISSEQECTLEEAERIMSKIDTASMSAADLKEISEGFSQRWSVEIQNVVKTFQAKSVHGNVQNIYLGGGGSLMDGFTEKLSTDLGIPVSILNPFDVIKVNPKDFSDAFIQRAVPFASIALGLALRRVDDK